MGYLALSKTSGAQRTGGNGGSAGRLSQDATSSWIMVQMPHWYQHAELHKHTIQSSYTAWQKALFMGWLAMCSEDWQSNLSMRRGLQGFAGAPRHVSTILACQPPWLLFAT